MSECSICGERGFERLYQLPNGNLRRCLGCRTVSRENLVGEYGAIELYDDDAYLDAPYFEALKVGASREQEPYFVYQRVLDRLAGEISPGRLLDVGCSYGAFLEVAAESGWEPRGLDLSSKATQYARRERGLEVFRGTLEEARFPDASFEAVTLWDVIEHLERPLDTARELHRILAPGGILVLFTINQQSLINRTGHLVYWLTGGKWAKPLVLLYDIHHNFFFDETTMRGMLGRAGFGRVRMDWMEANIERWQNVPIPVTLALGTKMLDLASRVLGGAYRMIVLAQKGT